MNQKISLTGIKARTAFIKGADYVADTVIASIGPFGLNADIEKGNVITNDGFKISKDLCQAVENEFERRGALTFHTIASKTNDQVGDATSSSEALGKAIIKEAIRLLPNETMLIGKKSPSQIIKQLAIERDEVIAKLQSGIKMIESEEELINSAKVSVEDDNLAKLIGEAQWKIGKDGIIIPEETPETTCSIEYVQGIRIDNGFGTSSLMNNDEKKTLEISDAATILTNYTIDGVIQLKPILDQIVLSGKRDIMVVARAFSSQAIQEIMKNHESNIRIYPINCPFTNMAEIMRDLQAVLGGRYIDTEEASLEDMMLSDVGFTKKTVARRYDAIIAGNGDDNAKDRIIARITKLQDELKGSVSDFEKKQLQSRIAQLENGTAILKVGAETLTDRNRIKDKCDDAVNATRLALQGGTVKGGGLAFKEISDSFPDTYLLKRPLNVIYNQIMSSAPEGFVIEDWVRDPFLVLKAALTNACSVAGTMATTNCVITTRNPHSCSCGNINNNQE